MTKDFKNLAASRFSERRFASTPVEDEKLMRVLEAGRLAPTAENLQPQRIYVARGEEALAKIDAGTRCRFGAPVVLILAYDVTVAARHPDVCDFGIVDTSIVATHMMLEAEELGLHTCWVGLIDPPELRRQFKIAPTHRIISVMPLGYPGAHSRPAHLHNERVPLEQTVTFL